MPLMCFDYFHKLVRIYTFKWVFFFFFIWHEPLQRLYVEFNDAAIAQNTFEAILLE